MLAWLERLAAWFLQKRVKGVVLGASIRGAVIEPGKSTGGVYGENWSIRF